jgi:RHS repeat-associated protein
VRTTDGKDATYYHHVDHLGTTETITDAAGTVVWDASYEAYGKLVHENGTVSFKASFTGKQVDSDTGLYYFNARWYDAELGRFVTEDPARDGRNWYEYCGNNPLVRIDPTGNEDYNSSITQEQYGKSFYLQRQYDWNEVQDFFESNPEGVLHRYPDTTGFTELSSKNEIVDMNEPGAELVQLIAGGKKSGLFKGLQSLFERVGHAEESLVPSVPEKGGVPSAPYPSNNGAIGRTERFTLMPGDKIDRYGNPSGKYFSPEGTPLDMRSLPPNADLSKYNLYTIKKPFEVNKSTISPYYGKNGMGIQYESPVSAEVLLKKGIIEQ